MKVNNVNQPAGVAERIARPLYMPEVRSSGPDLLRADSKDPLCPGDRER